MRSGDESGATLLYAGKPGRSYLADTVRLGYAENTGGFLRLGADWPPRARTAVFTVATGVALLALMIHDHGGSRSVHRAGEAWPRPIHGRWRVELDRSIHSGQRRVLVRCERACSTW